MNFKEKLLGFSLISFSIISGIFLVECLARYLGLGNPLLYEPDKLVGYRLKPSQSQKRRKNAIVTSNEEGFRINPAARISSKSKFIVFVGDSVTYGGSYIDDKDLFSSKYCQIIENNNICLNNGINAWGTMNMGRFISNFEIYSKIVPEKFILVILPGDEGRNLKSFTDTPFWSSSPKHPKGINEVSKFIFLKYILPSFESKNKIKNVEAFEKNENKKSILVRKQAWKELDLYIENSKYPIDVIVTPPKVWFDDENNKKEINIYNELLLSLNSKNINRKCNLFNFLKNDYSPDLYVDGVHLNNKGHELWSKKIYECINL